MDNSKIGQPGLSYSCGAGTAEVNLYTGRVVFEHEDMALGAGIYATKLSHVYNSFFDLSKDDGTSRFKTYMGSKWKLNVQQFVFKCDFISTDVIFGEYIYIDALGNWHRFSKTVSHDDEYYDASGTGLIMELRGGTPEKPECLIYDRTGNYMKFLDGRLVETGDCLLLRTIKNINRNDYVKHFYHYEDDLLTRITIQGHKENTAVISMPWHFELTYKDNLLKQIRAVNDGNV